MLIFNGFAAFLGAISVFRGQHTNPNRAETFFYTALAALLAVSAGTVAFEDLKSVLAKSDEANWQASDVLLRKFVQVCAAAHNAFALSAGAGVLFAVGASTYAKLTTVTRDVGLLSAEPTLNPQTNEREVTVFLRFPGLTYGPVAVERKRHAWLLLKPSRVRVSIFTDLDGIAKLTALSPTPLPR